MRTGYPLRASALLGLVALLTLSGGASGAVPAAKAKPANGPIGALAMDGARVAYDVVGNLPRRCNRVRVWNVLTGASRIASGKGTCGADTTSTGEGVRELAIARSRVAWIVNIGGNSESDELVYAVNTAAGTGRLVFVPRSRLVR